MRNGLVRIWFFGALAAIAGTATVIYADAWYIGLAGAALTVCPLAFCVDAVMGWKAGRR